MATPMGGKPRFRLSRKLQFINYVLKTYEDSPTLSWTAMWDHVRTVKPGITDTAREGDDPELVMLDEWKLWYKERHTGKGESRIGHGKGSEYYRLMKKWHEYHAGSGEYKIWRSKRLSEWHGQTGQVSPVGPFGPVHSPPASPDDSTAGPKPVKLRLKGPGQQPSPAVEGAQRAPSPIGYARTSSPLSRAKAPAAWNAINSPDGEAAKASTAGTNNGNVVADPAPIHTLRSQRLMHDEWYPSKDEAERDEIDERLRRSRAGRPQPELMPPAVQFSGQDQDMQSMPSPAVTPNVHLTPGDTQPAGDMARLSSGPGNGPHHNMAQATDSTSHILNTQASTTPEKMQTTRQDEASGIANGTADSHEEDEANTRPNTDTPDFGISNGSSNQDIDTSASSGQAVHLNSAHRPQPEQSGVGAPFRPMSNGGPFSTPGSMPSIANGRPGKRRRGSTGPRASSVEILPPEDSTLGNAPFAKRRRTLLNQSPDRPVKMEDYQNGAVHSNGQGYVGGALELGVQGTPEVQRPKMRLAPGPHNYDYPFHHARGGPVVGPGLHTCGRPPDIAASGRPTVAPQEPHGSTPAFLHSLRPSPLASASRVHTLNHAPPPLNRKLQSTTSTPNQSDESRDTHPPSPKPSIPPRTAATLANLRADLGPSGLDICLQALGPKRLEAVSSGELAGDALTETMSEVALHAGRAAVNAPDRESRCLRLVEELAAICRMLLLPGLETVDPGSATPAQA
ncbi:hypothetical protein LTR53_005753 [Teratosphaeriaceae sp. CCFEE 6253]|nr:hypothetical protein LTR53_005753 [Teratosphaeriaceae sp. CCFEE 6253]